MSKGPLFENLLFKHKIASYKRKAKEAAMKNEAANVFGKFIGNGPRVGRSLSMKWSSALGLAKKDIGADKNGFLVKCRIFLSG